MVIKVNSNPLPDVIKSYRDNQSLSMGKSGSVGNKPADKNADVVDFSNDTFAVFSIWHDTAETYDVRDIKISDIAKMSGNLYQGGAITLEEHGALSSFKDDSGNSEQYVDLVKSYGDKLANDFEHNDIKTLGIKRNVMEHLKKLDIAKIGAVDIVA